MNLCQPISKQSQLYNKRQKLTQRQMGEISQKVDQELKRRSGGNCELQEKCKGASAVQRAHITARGKLTYKTTAADLLHVCLACHKYLDETPEGIKYKRTLRGA